MTSISEPAVTASPWRKAALSALYVWLGSHIAYFIVNVLHWHSTNQKAPALHQILGAWKKWDAIHYLRIAAHGYQPQYELDRAFFPLFPLLIRVADAILPSTELLAGLVVSNVAAYGALVMLHRLTALEMGAEVADRTIYYLVAFPTAFFLVAPYNHSLFLLLATASLYAMRTGRWWLAGLVAGLCSATRSDGVLLALPFVYEYLRQREFKWQRIRLDALAIFLVPSGLIAYAVYCQIAFGNFWAFSDAQRFWYRKLDFPWDALWRTIREPFKYHALDELSLVNLIDFTAAVSFLVLLAMCLIRPWRLRDDQWYLFIFGAAILMLPLVTPATDSRPLISMARHVLDVIPAFMILGRLGANKIFDRLYVMPAIAFQVMLLTTFMNYSWAG